MVGVANTQPCPRCGNPAACCIQAHHVNCKGPTLCESCRAEGWGKQRPTLAAALAPQSIVEEAASRRNPSLVGYTVQPGETCSVEFPSLCACHRCVPLSATPHVSLEELIKRRLTYRFFSRPWTQQLTLLLRFGLIEEEDRGVCNVAGELWERAYTRAGWKNLTGALADELAPCSKPKVPREE